MAFSSIPVADPKASYLAYKEEIDLAVQEVLDSGWYILGRQVEAFEKNFADYVGVKYAIGVGSGTDALHLSLRTCGIGEGDAVFTVSHTAVATVAAIELAGAVPVLVDIDPSTYTMDANCLEDAVKSMTGKNSSRFNLRPSAVIPVHLYGCPANLKAILDIAERFGLDVIEDSAQAHGASLHGRKAGSWGRAAAFSFYPTKNLGGIGDGGAIVTNDESLAESALLMREYGWRERYISEVPGMNTRLDEIQAAVLRVKLRHIDEENARRRELADKYNDGLSFTRLILPQLPDSVEHVYHQYVVRSERRNQLREFLHENSIGTLIHYPVPVHLQLGYGGRVIIAGGRLRNTEQICREVLSLPMHPHMTDHQIRRVIQLIAQSEDKEGW
ncbi:MAG: DegT/DnrJ/EryC1/StrS family aminotransferase [Desulfobacterales bacterium]|nr:MAG: DegT/DnrJ/EryC1/StrS family aminotransferase [Desulfobacterales bacterium]